MYNTFYLHTQMDPEKMTLESSIEEVQRKMEKFNVNFDGTCIYLLGLTGSGKSSLITYLMGAKDQLKVEKKMGQYRIINENVTDFPLIGNTETSCTDIPATYPSLKGNSIFIDASGFMDTKGDIQEIINGYSNARMFKRGTKTKILLVVEQSTLISGRGGKLPEIARRLLELFPRDFSNLINSIAVVVSKVNTEDVELADVLEHIQGINDKNQNMPVECRAMISNIVERGNVILFPLPRCIRDETITQMSATIENMPATILQEDAQISLDYKSKLMLTDLGKKSTDQLNKLARRVEGQLEQNFVNVNYPSTAELDTQIVRLKKAITLLANELSQDNFKPIFWQFSQLIGLNEAIEAEILSCISKIQFIMSLSTSIQVSHNIIGSIINSLRSTVSSLDSKMQKMATQEQIKEMNDRHERDLERRRAEFDEMRREMANESQRREKDIKAQLAAQEKFMTKMMEESSKSHKEEMARLTAEITKLANRPPQVIHKKSGWCSLM